MEERVQIEGTVVALKYQNPENGYTVLSLDTEDGVVTAVGPLPGVSPGETLLLTGAWTTHAEYGEQFKAESAVSRPPQEREAIYRYLASGAIKNIGEKRARDIVDRFGEDSLRVIEEEPHKLASVDGITPARAKTIGSWYRSQTSLKRLIGFLSEYDIKPITAIRLHRIYGDEAEEQIRENPYILTGSDFGSEFFEADRLALSLGFPSDGQERVEAAVLFELSHNLTNGHVFLPYAKLLAATNALIDAGAESISDALDALCDGGFIVRETVAGQDAVYLKEYYDAERYVADRLLDMASHSVASEKDISRLIEKVEGEQGVVYADAQRSAVELSAENLVMVLTGGPGTGKTTALRGILALFDILGLKTALCAPTGRAAHRMSDICHRDAATVHRMLGAGLGEGGALVFEYNEDNTLNADAVIVDETSMVDITLLHSLLLAMRPGCRLVLVGDADQLPSVGPGNVFSDIIRSGAVKTVRLTEIFRQAGGSAIVRSAHLINRGEKPDLSQRDGDLFFLKRATPEKAAETIAELVSQRLPKNMGIAPSQIQVLTPARKYETGTIKLNLRLQAALNPPGPGKKEKLFGNFVYRTGDKVMQIRNNYDIIWKSPDLRLTGTGIYNGDIGFVREINIQEETLVVDYEDKLVTYLFDQLSELEPAYALTVHKSQGSEYRAVILAASRAAPQLLNRSVLYTAVTRARELLIIVGEEAVIDEMIGNNQRTRRYSGLRARMAD